MKKILITVLIIITSAPLWAGPVKLSLEDAIRICETENLLLSAQKEELRGEEAKTKQIEGLTKGSLDITGGYTRLDDDITMALDLGALPFTVPDVTLGPKDQVHLIASYVAPLYTGGKLRNSILASKEGLEAKKQKLESDTDKTVLSAAESYLLSLLTKALLDVNTEALETVKKHKEQAEIAYETGTAAKYDVIRAESAVKDREGKLYEAKANHESALMALKTILNIDKAEEIELSDSLGFQAPDSDAETLIQRAEHNNPGLKALSKKIKASEFLKKAESGSRMPQFSAIAAGQLVTGNINKIEPEWLFGVNMTFNIFDGGITGAKIDEAEHKIAAARLEKENAASYLELGIRSALLRLEAAQKSLEAAQAAVALAREALRLAERRFETGNGTGIEVLDAQTALSSAEAAEKNALYKGEMIDLEIKSYCGLLRKNKENL